MQHNLILVFLGRLDTKCPTYFAENYSGTGNQPLNLDQIQKEQSSKSPGGRRGQHTSGASGKGAEVVMASSSQGPF